MTTDASSADNAPNPPGETRRDSSTLSIIESCMPLKAELQVTAS